MRNRPSDFLPLVHTLLPQKHHRVCEHRAFAPLGPIWLRSASQTQQRGRGAPGATWLSAAAPHAARNGRSTAATPVPDPGCAAPPHSYIPTPPGSARPLNTQKTKRISVGPREPRSRGAEGEPLSLRSRGHGGTGKSDKTERGKRTAHLAVDHHHVPLIASAGRAARSAGPAAGLRGAPRGSAPLRAARRPGPLRAGHGAPQPPREPPAPAARSAQRSQERGAECGAGAGGLRREGGERRLRPERGAERDVRGTCAPASPAPREDANPGAAPLLAGCAHGCPTPCVRICTRGSAPAPGVGTQTAAPVDARQPPPGGAERLPSVCVRPRGCAPTPRGCRFDPRPVHSGCSSMVARLFPG